MKILGKEWDELGERCSKDKLAKSGAALAASRIAVPVANHGTASLRRKTIRGEHRSTGTGCVLGARLFAGRGSLVQLGPSAEQGELCQCGAGAVGHGHVYETTELGADICFQLSGYAELKCARRLLPLACALETQGRA